MFGFREGFSGSADQMERYFQFYQTQDTSHRQDPKDYTIIDLGSTESGGQFTPPHFLKCGVRSMLFDPNFFMQKSIVGSLFVEAVNVNVVVYLR